MKKIGLLLIFAVSIISCKKDGYEVSGTAKGIENGKKVFIEIMDDAGMPIAIDTSVVENEKFKLEGKLKNGIELAFVKFENNVSLPIVLENGSITVDVIKDSVQGKIGGTKNNDLFQSFNDMNKSVMKKATDFQKVNNQKYMTAMQSQDMATIQSLQNEMKKFQDEMNKNSKDFVEKNPSAFISVLLIESFVNAQSAPMDEIKKQFDKLDKSLLETKTGKKLQKTIETYFTVSVGKPAPDFSANTPDGKKMSLKESLGKVTIIDFWASWCAPCRAENPNVVALYNEFHAQGLNIIGVSLDKEAKDWKDAIAKDGLTWNHVSNLKHWKEPIAELYNVKSVPATFILDANGVIVAKDLRGEELKAKVKELLAK